MPPPALHWAVPLQTACSQEHDQQLGGMSEPCREPATLGAEPAPGALTQTLSQQPREVAGRGKVAPLLLQKRKPGEVM